MTRRIHPGRLLFLLFNLCVVAFLLAPIVVILAASTGETGFLKVPPQGFTLKWMSAALSDPRYVRAFWTSIEIAIWSTILSSVIGTAAAVAIVRQRFRGARALEAMFLSPLMLPHLVLAVGLVLMFSDLRLTGQYRLVAAHLTVCIPYVIRTAIPALQRFDISIEEAAVNLGASRFAAFFLVTLPSIRPGVIAGAVLAFIMSFDELVLALFLASPRDPTLPATIYSAVQLGMEPTVAAVSALLILATAVLTVAYHLISGAGRSRSS